MNFKKDKCNVLHTGWGNPKHRYTLRREWIECSLRIRTLECCSTWTSNMHLQPRKLTMSWDAPKAAWPAGWLSPALLPWGVTCSATCRSGVPNPRKTWSWWSGPRGESWGWSEGWRISLMKNDWGNWGSSAWRSKGSEGFYWCLSAPNRNLQESWRKL